MEGIVLRNDESAAAGLILEEDAYISSYDAQADYCWYRGRHRNLMVLKWLSNCVFVSVCGTSLRISSSHSSLGSKTK